jgi:hypothetical protein
VRGTTPRGGASAGALCVSSTTVVVTITDFGNPPFVGINRLA